MSVLFTPWTIRTLTLPNRLIRSATWEGMANEDGFAGHELVEFYRELARGGVGLIVTGFAYVRREGKSLPKQLGIYSDDHILGLSRMASAVHEAGGRIFVQIVHAGGQVDPKILGGLEPVAPSSVLYPSSQVTPRALSTEEIPPLVQAFADAARRVKSAGFDGVQLHAAHGYLINRFLSPASNQREDGYGGLIASRARFGVEVLRAVRYEVGPEFPVSVKLNGDDFEERGLTLDDAVVAARLFAQAGADHIEVSGGTPASGKRAPMRSGIDAPPKEAYFRNLAVRIKRGLTLPVGVVGGVRSFEVAEQIVAQREADTVSMARPLICEPDLPNRWRSGDTQRAQCVSDSACFIAGLKSRLRCTTLRP